MIQTVEGVVDKEGRVRLLEKAQLPAARRALVTILEEDQDRRRAALFGEAALAEDWNRPEEDEACSHLRSER